jgi:hypothetical protein
MFIAESCSSSLDELELPDLWVCVELVLINVIHGEYLGMPWVTDDFFFFHFCTAGMEGGSGIFLA